MFTFTSKETFAFTTFNAVAEQLELAEDNISVPEFKGKQTYNASRTVVYKIPVPDRIWGVVEQAYHHNRVMPVPNNGFDSAVFIASFIEHKPYKRTYEDGFVTVRITRSVEFNTGIEKRFINKISKFNQESKGTSADRQFKKAAVDALNDWMFNVVRKFNEESASEIERLVVNLELSKEYITEKVGSDEEYKAHLSNQVKIHERIQELQKELDESEQEADAILRAQVVNDLTTSDTSSTVSDVIESLKGKRKFRPMRVAFTK